MGLRLYATRIAKLVALRFEGVTITKYVNYTMLKIRITGSCIENVLTS